MDHYKTYLEILELEDRRVTIREKFLNSQTSEEISMNASRLNIITNEIMKKFHKLPKKCRISPTRYFSERAEV
jgi:hypothetical protein